MNYALLALLLSAFGIGTTEFIIVGLLPNIAHDLHCSIPQTGMIITIYALSVAFGCPLVAVLTNKLPRRTALLILMLIFVVGNVLSALASSYLWLSLSRMLTALCHGSFFGLGAVVASNLVPGHKKTQAISVMFAGLTLANILGVPIGTAIGQAYGWRTTFWLVAGVGVIAMLALYRWLPKQLMIATGDLFTELGAICQRQVIFTMLISICVSASLFSVFTYIVPLLEEVTHISARAITGVLLLFGLGITMGNLLGGKFADYKLMPTVITLCSLLTITLFCFASFSASVPVAVTLIFIWGVLSFGLCSPLQMRVVDAAQGAPNLASTLNQSAFHIGNASGAFLSSLALQHGAVYGSLPWLGMGIMLLALTLSVISSVTS